MAEVDWNFQLAEQLDWHWREQLRPRLDGLTDAEYRWEPVAGAWTVRPRGTGMARAGPGRTGPDLRPGRRPVGTAPMAELVLHINREMLHHGAEIALLRDLYRWHYDGGRTDF
jgi:hypothetical protein